MNKLPLEELLMSANQAVMEGNWAKALDYLQQVYEMQPYNADLLTAIAGVQVQMGKVEEALQYYQDALRLQPYSAQAHQNLGIAYTILGRYSEAEDSYRRALELDEDNRFSWMGLARVCIVLGKVQEGVEILAALVKSDPQDPQALTLLAECYEQGGDFASARELYQQALNVDDAYELAQKGLERVKSQESALDQVDKQALAQKLNALKSKLQAQQVRVTSSQPSSATTILFCGPAMVSSELRFGALAQELNRRGYQVRVTTRAGDDSKETLHYAFFSRPHFSEELTQAVLRIKADGTKVIVDLDEDFFALPPEYEGYASLSAVHPQIALRLRQVLQAADVVTVPSESLQDVYRSKTNRVVLLPYGWDETNPMWTKPILKGAAAKVGIVATHTQPPDLPALGNSLQRIFQENGRVLLGIIAGMEVYEKLNGIDEERKFFVPPSRIEDYPFLLADFDLLLFPLADNSYNRSKSDLALLECAARKVCWVATPIPAYQAWEKGGLFASSAVEWKEAIETLLNSPTQRYQLSEEGHRKAQQRTTNKITEQWIELLQSL